MDTLRVHGPGSEEPLYLAVYGALRDALTRGEWVVGASLPSEADLSGQFQVSRITVRHALRLLETEGYIRKARARRPVVVRTTEPPPICSTSSTFTPTLPTWGKVKARIWLM